MKSKRQPETKGELLDALNKLGVEVEERGGIFFAYSGTSTTRLDAEDFESALFEAWNLYKE